MNGDVHVHLDLVQPEEQRIRVTMRWTGSTSRQILQFPLWTPGSYTIRDPVQHRNYDSRSALDRDLVQRFQSLGVEGIVMAGWMRIVTNELIQAFPDRLINIHPSLLPSFRGLDGVGQALKAGVRLAGCTVHLVTEDLDAGPILVQAAVPVLDTDSHDSLSQRIQQQEHRILPTGLMLAADRWRQG